MIDPEILANNSYEEIIEALIIDLKDLVAKAQRAQEAGDENQYDILHGLIDEDLDMLEIAQAEIPDHA